MVTIINDGKVILISKIPYKLGSNSYTSKPESI